MARRGVGARRRALTAALAAAACRGAAAFTCALAGRRAAACAALGELYSAAGGASWAFNVGWADAATGRAVDYCAFYGVACDAQGDVTALSLRQNGLSGSLPPALGALTALSSLDLSGNVLVGSIPETLGSLTSLTSLTLSHNVLSGMLPDAFAALGNLSSLGLTVNALSGSLPAFLGALPALTRLLLEDNFFTGTVPASLGERAPFAELTFGHNLLNSTSFPRSLCAAACAAAEPPFLCPVTAPCSGNDAGGNCSAQCHYPACPVRGLTASDFAFVADKCVLATPHESCVVCLPAILSVFYLPPASLTDADVLMACLVYYTPEYLAAGAAPFALGMISNCGPLFGFSYDFSSASCPVTLRAERFAAVAVACSSPDSACGACFQGLAALFHAAGVDASAVAPAGSALYDVLGVCIDAHLPQLLAAGADAPTLSHISSCAELSGYFVFASVSLGGVSAATFNSGVFKSAISTTADVRPSDIRVENFTDTTAGDSSRRHLAAAALLVDFSIAAASAAEQRRISDALRGSVQSGMMMQQLRAAGLPANSVTLLDLRSVGSGAVAAADAAAADKALGSGGVAGVVLGGAALLGLAGAIAGVALARRRRRRMRLLSGGLAADAVVVQHQKEDNSGRGGQEQLLGVTPWQSSPRTPLGGDHANGEGGFYQSSSTSGDDATSATTSASASATADVAAAGWRAVAADASELQLGDAIGAGAFATVHAATWRGSLVAVKVWQHVLPSFATSATGSATGSGGTAHTTELAPPPAADASFLQEVQLLSQLRHPNILAIYALVKSPPMLVMELGAAGSLKDLLGRTSLGNLGWARRMGIATGVACGVEFLHAQEPPIIHGDLKCGNIVLDVALVPRVADFGVSWVARHDVAAQRQTHGTPQYCAPEVARGALVSNSKAIDAFGVGMLLHDVTHVNTDAAAAARLAAAGVDARAALTQTLASGTVRPWSSVQVLFRREAANYLPAFAPHVPQPVCDLMRAALAMDPDARPTLTQMRTRIALLAEQAAAW